MKTFPVLHVPEGEVFYPYPELEEWYPSDLWGRIAWQQHKPSTFGAQSAGDAWSTIETEFLLMNYPE